MMETNYKASDYFEDYARRISEVRVPHPGGYEAHELEKRICDQMVKMVNWIESESLKLKQQGL